MSDDFVHESDDGRILFGWGRAGALAGEVERLLARRVLLISERSTRAHADAAAARLGELVVERVDGVSPHVPSDEVEDVRRIARARSVDAVVSIGGGSATGLGKAVVREVDAPLVALPTTYAGSEMTPIYGVTSKGRKRTGRDERTRPRVVVYDPALTVSLPARVTAGSGMNALAHCVEALYARDLEAEGERAAIEGLEVMPGALRECIAEPGSRPARTRALYGAYLAGTALAGAGMAVHHRICHVLGGTFGLAHGDANAVVLPHALSFNAPAAPVGLEKIGAALGSGSPAGTLYVLAAGLGAPASLAELGLPRAALGEAARIVIESDFYNPRPVGAGDVLAILEAAWAGTRPSG